jgi:signal transduction histidine kinase/ActR/RegA family two-component response regulator
MSFGKLLVTLKQSHPPLPVLSSSPLPLSQLLAIVAHPRLSWTDLPQVSQLQVQLWLEQAIQHVRSHLDQLLITGDREAAIQAAFLGQLEIYLDVKADEGWQAELRQTFLARSTDQLNVVIQLANDRDDLIQKNRELTQISQLKSEFLANTSHEIRTPLSSILGFTHLLREQGLNPDSLRHQEYLRIILTSGQHLLALINDILDLSKIEANQMDLEWEPIDLAALCKTVLILVKEKANDKGITLKLDLAPELALDLALQADPLRLKQMLFNLLSNALKFTDQGVVGLRVQAAGEFVRFVVWDTGVGIDAEQQASLFRAYKQLSQSETTRGEGTGLGLALTQKLAELHGGWVEVASTRGEGSTFTIVLPLIPLPIERPVTTSTTPPILQTVIPAPIAVTPNPVIPNSRRFRQASRSYHILLVEDNSNNARLIIAYLCKLGYEVTWAKDSETMWRSLTQSLPAVILMDVNLPGTSGLTLTRQLREQERYCHIPIIAQTAMAMTGDKEICLEAGVNDYVTKPIDLPHLAEVMARYSAPSMAKN